MTLIDDSEHHGCVFSLVWLRVGDVWRAGAGLVTIVTFVMAPSFFSLSQQYREHLNSRMHLVCFA